MTVTFDKRKKDFLGKGDKSSIGGWDKPILKLLDKLNKKKDYYTLSSCSGRIVVIRNVVKKVPNIFVFREHRIVKFTEVAKVFSDYRGKDGLVFKQEPCILHVACRDLGAARNLLKKALLAGWKNSGIIVISDNRVIVDLRSTEAISFPIHNCKNLLVDRDFLKFIVKEANKRLLRSWDKIKKFEALV